MPEFPCPNCQRMIPDGSEFCPNCGYAPYRMPPEISNYPQADPVARRGSSAATIVWVLLLVFVGFPAGLLGGCLMLVGTASASEGGAGIFLLGALGVAITIFLFIMLMRSFKSR